MKALEKDRTRRYESASGMATRLAALSWRRTRHRAPAQHVLPSKNWSAAIRPFSSPAPPSGLCYSRPEFLHLQRTAASPWNGRSVAGRWPRFWGRNSGLTGLMLSQGKVEGAKELMTHVQDYPQFHCPRVLGGVYVQMGKWDLARAEGLFAVHPGRSHQLRGLSLPHPAALAGSLSPMIVIARLNAADVRPNLRPTVAAEIGRDCLLAPLNPGDLAAAARQLVLDWPQGHVTNTDLIADAALGAGLADYRAGNFGAAATQSQKLTHPPGRR